MSSKIPSISSDQSAILCRCSEVTYQHMREQMEKNPHASFDEIKDICNLAKSCANCESNALHFYAERCQNDPLVDASIKKTRAKLFITKCIRSFHLFSSLIAAIFLLFFAFSGYIMNHGEEYGLDDVEESTREASLPKPLLVHPKKPELMQWCEDQGAVGDLAEYIQDEDQILISYVSAGSRFEAEIDPDSGEVSILTQKNSFLETLGEIHRSPSADDKSTSLFIDLMALLMGIVSISGILLFFRLATRQNKLELAVLVLSVLIAIVTLMVKAGW